MVKKLGLVVATAAAALLAASPLAFAADKAPHGELHGNDSMVNFSDNAVIVPTQVCNNDVPINGGVAPVQGNVKDLAGAAAGALAFFGSEADADNDIKTDTSRECDMETEYSN